MTPYTWTCHVCESVNGPNGRYCSACGFPAVATGTKIERARARLEGRPENNRCYGVLPLVDEIPTYDAPGDEKARANLAELHEKLSEMHRHEDDLLNSRFQGFLVATSLLAAAFSQFRDPHYLIESVFIAIVGAVLSLTIVRVLRRTSVAIEWYIATLCNIERSIWPDNQRPYDTRRVLRKSSCRAPISAILGVYIPSAVALFWVVMGFIAVSRP